MARSPSNHALALFERRKKKGGGGGGVVPGKRTREAL